MRSRSSVVFVARYAAGSLTQRACGSAAIAGRPNISTLLAGWSGILSPHGAYVRAAVINGFGHHVCVATNGLSIKNGMRRKIKLTAFNSKRADAPPIAWRGIGALWTML